MVEFILGFFIGGMVGFFACALMRISKQSDIVGTINEPNKKENQNKT